MDYLVDTHIALWALVDPSRLSPAATLLLEDPIPAKYVSHVSVWEVAIKHLAHPDRMPISSVAFAASCKRAGFRLLAPSLESVTATESLPFGEDVADGHKDPFDRLLICQARQERLGFVTHDSRIGRYNLPFVELV